jgi:hypothetical protein
MLDSGPVQNMYSTLSNKLEKLCVLLAFIIRIYLDAWSSECQILNSIFIIMQPTVINPSFCRVAHVLCQNIIRLMEEEVRKVCHQTNMSVKSKG